MSSGNTAGMGAVTVTSNRGRPRRVANKAYRGSSKQVSDSAAYYAPYVPLTSVKLSSSRKKKVSIMNWLKRVIHDWSRPEDNDYDVREQKLETARSEGLRNYHQGISFSMHVASGGIVMEYNSLKDGAAKLHVIPNIDNVGEEVQKIIITETLIQ